ncbi:MAG: SigE family RNA polymerase sigma factor [Nocardioidaceae bacterium]
MRDTEEFQEFAIARTPALYRAARLMSGDPSLAEDLVQETLAKVYLAWGRRRIDNPAAYARVILVRTFISSKRRRSASELPMATCVEISQNGAGSDDVDLALRMDLAAGLASLPASDRAVLVARYFDDQSIGDIAVAIKKSPAATRRQASRALEKLRLALGPDYAVEGALS